MKVIVTCGPSYEPIDEVRRLTNFSTGRLGITLANSLTRAGHEVICFKGEQSTFPMKVQAAETIVFTTNDDLVRKLRSIAGREVGAIFHAAALCDFKVTSVLDSSGQCVISKKIPTAHGELLLRLAPTLKVLPKLRRWFPGAHIVGWKYEAAGSCDEVLDKAFAQIRSAKTNACIANGPAYGAGFGFCAPDGSHTNLKDSKALLSFLTQWLGQARLKFNSRNFRARR